VNCEHCGHKLTPCIHAAEKMQVRAWWCQGCGWHGPAKLRERLLTVEQVVSESKYRGND
jgi:hypothetical protein